MPTLNNTFYLQCEKVVARFPHRQRFGKQADVMKADSQTIFQLSQLLQLNASLQYFRLDFQF